jgi:hypothetical protein
MPRVSRLGAALIVPPPVRAGQPAGSVHPVDATLAATILDTDDYLIERGIEPTRLTVAGYGESQPMVSNDDEAGPEHNRRVEFEIISRGEP